MKSLRGSPRIRKETDAKTTTDFVPGSASSIFSCRLREHTAGITRESRMLRGRCLCGAIQYQTNGAPYNSVYCHCSLCRRASGASPVAWFSVPLATFRFTTVVPSHYQSSPHATRSFCGVCGSQLTFQSLKTPQEIDITTCSLDNPELVPPQSHIHTSTKMSWVTMADGLAHHAGSGDQQGK